MLLVLHHTLLIYIQFHVAPSLHHCSTLWVRMSDFVSGSFFSPDSTISNNRNSRLATSTADLVETNPQTALALVPSILRKTAPLQTWMSHATTSKSRNFVILCSCCPNVMDPMARTWCDNNASFFVAAPRAHPRTSVVRGIVHWH